MEYKVKVSPKYQVVIPKEVRDKLTYLKPGLNVTVEITDGTINISKPLTDKAKGHLWLKKATGALRGTYGNPDKYISNIRSELGERDLPWQEKST